MRGSAEVAGVRKRFPGKGDGSNAAGHRSFSGRLSVARYTLAGKRCRQKYGDHDRYEITPQPHMQNTSPAFVSFRPDCRAHKTSAIDVNASPTVCPCPTA